MMIVLIGSSTGGCPAVVALVFWRRRGRGPPSPQVLTPRPGPAPRINGAKVFGVRPGSPFLFTIPATGERPLRYAAKGLPEGLRLDPETGQISGRLDRAGNSRRRLRGLQPPRHRPPPVPDRLRRHPRPDAAHGLE